MSDDGSLGEVRRAAGRVERHPAAVRWAASGHVVNGLVHAVIGIIALGIARGAGGTADQSGAMRAIRALPLGWVALWFVGIAMIGLAAYAVVLAVGKSRHDEQGGGRELARAWAYATVAIVALIFATGGSTDSEATAESLGAQLLLSWWGAGLLVVAGLITVGVGVAMISRGITRGFLEDIAPPPGFRGLFVGLGVAGYVAKGVAVAIVGILLVVAVVTRDPSNVAGLDGALKSLVALPGGRVLLYLVSGGLIVYGVFCLARARATLLKSPS